MTVAELGRRMSSAEVTEWQAFYRLEPFGRTADDMSRAVPGQIAVNMHLKKGARPIPLDEIVVDWSGELREQREKKGQSVETMKSILKAMHTAQSKKYGTKTRPKSGVREERNPKRG
jgi:hypothetical protein